MINRSVKEEQWIHNTYTIIIYNNYNTIVAVLRK